MNGAAVGRWRPRSPASWVSIGSIVLYALLAYVPSLASAPGRMPADTKLYLYLDPGGLVSRSTATFEPDQFAGWVPHQQITYLWPSGPYYWLLDAGGVPDWVAQRLWIGTIMFAAGCGVWWAARRLGLGLAGALVAGAVYQLSPYLLPYISRTSLLLLPWAALGWLVGLTVCATESAAPGRSGEGRRHRLAPWRYPAAIALVVATVGSANATALLLIAPAPALWLLLGAATGELRWRSALGIALRSALLCAVVSAWWVAMLITQSRHGAPVLAYSETLEDVSRNATGTEVLRGLGYWLFYGRDVYWPTTSAAVDHLDRTVILLTGYGLALLGLLGLVTVRWGGRRFAGLLVAVGMVLAVGVHPFDDPSPAMSLFAGDDGSGLALALRSSTRAVPLIVLGLALGTGAIVTSLGALRWRLPFTPRAVAAAAVIAVALLNMPALTGRRLVDPALERQQDPPEAWLAAAGELDAGDDGYRVLQVPGQEFGAFEWGYTVDQPVVGLADRDLVTRDLLPLGSAAAMDLLYALDDRIQAGALEAESVAPVARWLGVDTVWATNDAAFERFRTPRPNLVAAELASTSELDTIAELGAPAVPEPEYPAYDPTALGDPAATEAVAPVQLLAVADAVPVVRAKSGTVVVSGSGDGLVDAAAAGVLDGSELVRYSASLPPDELDDALGDASLVVVTDSNRDRAHHWRGSQDVHGHTEPGGPDDDVLRPTAADQRLAVFDHDDPDLQTVAVQEGPARAVASAYGEPFAYRPEDRAVMAIDGDPATAWLVGDHGDPRGERLRIELDAAQGPVETVRLLQLTPAPGGRSIARLRIEVPGGGSSTVELDQRSFDRAGGGQEVSIPAVPVGGSVELVIDEVSDADLGRRAGRAAVGLAEVDLGLSPTLEYIRPPLDAVRAMPGAADGTDLAIVLSRLRVDAADPWRDDPEPVLRRVVEVPADRQLPLAAEIRLDRRADDAVLAALLAPAASAPLPIAGERLDGAVGRAGRAAFDGDPTSAWMSTFDPEPGMWLQFTSDGPVAGTVDIIQPSGPYSLVTAVRLTDGRRSVEVPVAAPDAEGRSRIDLGEVTLEGEIELSVTAVEPRRTIDRRYGDPTVLPVAVAEIEGAGIPTVTIDPDAALQLGCDRPILEVDGRPVPLQGSLPVSDLLAGEAITATPCDTTFTVGGGEHRLVGGPSPGDGLTVDRVLLGERTPRRTTPVEVTVEGAGEHRSATVAPCPGGCWLVFGEGFNEAWSASVDGTSLGDPSLVDGGFNGWWLEPSDAPRVVEVRWRSQGGVDVALWLSAAAVLACIALLALSSRPTRPRPWPRARFAPWRPRSGGFSGRWWSVSLALGLTAALLVGWLWGLVAVLVSVGCGAASRSARTPGPGSLLAWTGFALATAVSAWVVWLERREHPFPNNGWTEAFDHLHRPTVVAVLCIAAGVLAERGPRRDITDAAR